MNLTEFRRLLDDYLKGNLKKHRQDVLQRWYDSFDESGKDVPAINGTEEDRLKAEILEGIRTHISAEDSRRSGVRWWGLVAAMLVILSGAGLFLITTSTPAAPDTALGANPFRTVRTQSVQMKRVLLPDSSLVFLNANSSIRFSSKFSDSLRLVYLDKGEAFFEVRKNEKRPFIIYAGALKVEVLGTSFNINAYPKLKNTSVAVNTGSVKVTDPSRSIFVLNVNERLTYHKQQQTSSVSHTTQKNHDWLKGNVVLENAGFEELAQVMLNIYGITLSTDLAIAKKYRYSLTIRSTRSVSETMELVCAIHNNKYRRTGHDILIY